MSLSQKNILIFIGSIFFSVQLISILWSNLINYPFLERGNNQDIQAYWYNIPSDSVDFVDGHRLNFQSALHIYGRMPKEDFSLQVEVYSPGNRKVWDKVLEIKQSVKPYFMEINDGYFKIRQVVEYLKETPDRIEVTIKSAKEQRKKVIKCRYHRLFGKITDFRGRPLKAFIGVCPDSFLSERLGKWSDSGGNYEIVLPERTYNALIIETVDKGVSNLEAWAWHIIVDEDQELDFKIGNGEVYNLNVWVNNGGGDAYFISFRPMLLKKIFPPKNYSLQLNEQEFNVAELAPPLGKEDLVIKINGKKAQIISIQKYFETGFLGQNFGLLSYLIQVSRQGLSRIGKQTVQVEYEKQIEVKGRKMKINSMGYYQFYLNYGGLSKYF